MRITEMALQKTTTHPWTGKLVWTLRPRLLLLLVLGEVWNGGEIDGRRGRMRSLQAVRSLEIFGMFG